MSIELILKIAAVGILAAVLHTVLSKAGRDDIAMAVSIAALALVMMVVVQLLGELFANMKNVFGLG